MRQLGGGARELGMMGSWWLKRGGGGGRRGEGRGEGRGGIEGRDRGEGVDERRYCQKENRKDK